MANIRYPADLAIGAEDFANSNWRQILEPSGGADYVNMWQSLSAAAKKAIASGATARGKVLWLLADACSMTLSPGSPNEPFKPLFTMAGRRSALPEDFTEADCQFLADIVDLIDEPLLKGRIADLLWLAKKPRDHRFALIAIDAYRSLPLDDETWIAGAGGCWERAVSLARLLGGGAGDRLSEIERTLIARLENHPKNDSFFPVRLAKVLETYELPHDKRIVIAPKLESLAKELGPSDDPPRSREYYAAAATWFRLGGDDQKAAEMTALQAESFSTEAKMRTTSENPSYLAAATFYENAIQTYRTIPHKHRYTLGVGARLDELRTLLNDSNARALGEMREIRGPAMDITQLINASKEAVRGKNTVEALRALANLYPGVNTSKLREQAIDQLRQHPLQAFLQATIVSSDGRVVAKRDPLNAGGAASEEDGNTIRGEMVQLFVMRVGLLIRAYLLPALETVLLEHRLREIDFVSLGGESPIVPKGREKLFGKALFAGYERDFSTALHLLVPQIEHMVRYHLKQAGETTTTLSPEGIESEVGLGALMEFPKAKQIFGENLHFEIAALFCDPFGPNLRNQVAHGLLEPDECLSAPSIYSWWFALRLVFNTWWNRAHHDETDGGSGQGEDLAE